MVVFIGLFLAGANFGSAGDTTVCHRSERRGMIQDVLIHRYLFYNVEHELRVVADPEAPSGCSGGYTSLAVGQEPLHFPANHA
jgi:hypothetical protein